MGRQSSRVPRVLPGRVVQHPLRDGSGQHVHAPVPTDDSNATLTPPLIQQSLGASIRCTRRRRREAVRSAPALYQEGGPNYGTVLNTFGGSSTAEYGSPYPSIYPADGSNNTAIITRYENYHQDFTNPCKNPGN